MFRCLVAGLIALILAGCETKPSYVKPGYDPAGHAKDHRFCVQVATEAKQYPTLPAVPCAGYPVYGDVVMSSFRVLVNSAAGTVINESKYGECMRMNDYLPVVMSRVDWEAFNGLPPVEARRKFLLEKMRQAQQKGR